MRRHRAIVGLAVVAALGLASCDGDGTETPQTPSPSGEATSPSPTATGVASEPDPAVPFSPEPTEPGDRTSGWLGETLVANTEDGPLWVTVDATAMTPFLADGTRALSVWMTLENPGDASWSGVPGADAKLTDQNGAEFSPVPSPSGDQLHPDPAAHGASNASLMRSVTLEPGDTAQGVLVFTPTGGNRPIVISMSLDGGGSFTEIQTNLGPF